MSMKLDTGLRKYLFFDDVLTQEKKGFVLSLNPAIRTDNPVLLPDKPWEAGGIIGDSNISIIEDDGVYKLWYVVRGHKKSDISGAEIKGFDDKTLADYLSQARYMLCYAISKDGINWEKPNLGIFEYEGSKRNNIVFAARLGCTVFKDPTAPAEERYKMIYGGGPRLPHVHLKDNIPTKNIYHAIYGATSPDGIHWKSYKEPIIPWYTDTTNVCYWDEEIKKYVAFVRWNENMVYEDGKTVIPESGNWKYRAIGRTESEDFKNFPPPTKIMEPSVEEREPYETGLDYYNSSAVKYPFAKSTYFLFFSIFYHNSDMLDVHLATSRDGVNYTPWCDSPFVRLGLANVFDSKCIYMATGMIRKGDEIWMYYAGYNVPHHVDNQPKVGGIGRVRIRFDGFVSQDVSSSEGFLTTKILQFSGNILKVNMDGSAGGWLKVEILDEKGKPIPGFTAKEANFLFGNDVNKIVTWKGRKTVSKLQGKPIHLRFIGKAVKLFAFQFEK
ncbi:hypothetical protein J7K25_03230 [bacterium]|nr:hypothetical protein [bacterium]